MRIPFDPFVAIFYLAENLPQLHRAPRWSRSRGCVEDFGTLASCQREWTQVQLLSLRDWLPVDAVTVRNRLTQRIESLGWRSYFQGRFWYTAAGIAGLVFARWATIAKLERFRTRREAIETIKLLIGIFVMAVLVWIVIAALCDGLGARSFHLR